MNVSLHLPPSRCLLVLYCALLGFSGVVHGQTSSAYKNLVTAANTAVFDTLSGQNMSVYKVSPLPKHGALHVLLLQSGGNGNPSVFAIRYTPDTGFTGVDTFTIEINYQGTYPYLIYRGYRVSVFPSLVNARSDFAVTTIGNPVTTNVLANDTSGAGPLTLSSLPLVNNGTAVITGGNSIQFTPDPGFIGIGHVNYVVCDSTGACKTGQFTIGVNNSASPLNDTMRVATTKNTPVTMPLNYEGYSLFQAPSSGSVLMNNGHAFRYAPNFNFTGTDQFILATDDYGTTVYKTVILDVLNVATPNTMAVDDYVYTPKGVPVSFNVRSNDIGNLLVKSWSIPGNLPGTVSGTTGSGNVTFNPNSNFTGIASFQYKIGNMFVPDLEIANVNVIVGNLAPSSSLFELTTPEATALVINYQIPFPGFNFNILDAPDHGSCVFYPGFTTLNINGQNVSGKNLLVYTPDNGYVGTDEFELNYCVTANNQCQSVKVQVNVVEVVSSTGPYCVGGCVWSGDVNADGVVNNRDVLPLGYYMGLSGPPRNNAALEWYGQFGNNWSNPYTGNTADLKHADTDGDGEVTGDDTLAVSYFYGQYHNPTPFSPPTSKGLPFSLSVTPANPGVGDLVTVKVSLGNASQPVRNLYGFTFNASLSPQILDSALQMTYYNGSWLNRNSPNLWMYKTPAQGRLESAFTRTNGATTSGHGPIGEFSFIIIDIIDDIKVSASPTFSISVDEPAAMWADGQTTVGESFRVDIPLRLQPKPISTNEDFLVYPSPAQDLVQFHLNGDAYMEQLSVLDATGKTVYQSGKVQWEHAELKLGNLPAGLYVAVAQGSDGQTLTHKFQIMK